ncbi:MAG: hypothetical protein LBF74_04755 [Treponema sp.]|jgi:hypothetical protein|nr:hypothetical protein [Treponema sp.]
MKKIVFLVSLCAVTAALALAEITVGGRVKAAVGIQHIEYAPRPENPTWIPDEETVWVGGFGRDDSGKIELKLTFTAEKEGKFGKAGIYSDLFFYPAWIDHKENDVLLNIDSIALGDLYGWYLPFDFFRVALGKYSVETFRGRIGGYNWGSHLGAAAGGEDSFLNKFDMQDGISFEFIDPLKYFSIPGLDLAFGFNRLSNLFSANNQGIDGGYVHAKYMLENFQIALGYKIKIGELDIGFARAQYISVHQTPSAGPVVQGAFAFTMVPGLVVDIGGTWSFPVTDPTTWLPGINSDGNQNLPIPIAALGEYRQPHRAAFGAIYDFSGLGLSFIKGLSVKAGMEYSWGGYSEPKESFTTNTGAVTKIWFSPLYKITEILSAGADLGINIIGSEEISGRIAKLGGTRYGAGAYVQIDMAESCNIKAGVAYSGGMDQGSTRMSAKALDEVFTVPVAFTWEF